MYKNALTHFKRHDPLLHKVALQLPAHHREVQPAPESDLLNSLCDAIISQQLSIKASATIFERFLNLFHNKHSGYSALTRKYCCIIGVANSGCEKSGANAS